MAALHGNLRPTPTPPPSCRHPHACRCAQCLTIIDEYYLKAKKQKYAGNGAGMVQTYGPGSIGGGPCGDEHCKLVEPNPSP